VRLKDKVAIITGAGRGIGRAYALRFVDEGAKVVIAEIILENAQKVVTEIEAKGGEALAIHTDVTEEASPQEMARKTVERFGKIDILMNNAAFFFGIGSKSWDAWTVDEWKKSFAINVVGSWLCMKAVVPHMIPQRKGKIINISTTTYDLGFQAMLPYTCTKGAVVGLTRTMARALGRYNINVNCIAPGYTTSEATLQMPGRIPEAEEAMIRGRALRRPELPADLVGTAVFLASEDSDFVTGQTLIVDGGEAMH
jgi:3-oxoacyl-[acyl-carrier protein] reductase